jgi:hypothetical protein
MAKDKKKEPQKSAEIDNIDFLVELAVFADEPSIREEHRRIIREMATGYGIRLASIHSLYEAAGRSAYHGLTVPAINIRGITYPVARAVFRAALKDGVGAFIFEIARSEIEYTRQRGVPGAGLPPGRPLPGAAGHVPPELRDRVGGHQEAHPGLHRSRVL